MNEFQGIPALRSIGAPLDDLELFATFQEEQLMYDEIEQTMQIYDMECCDRLQEYEKNNQERIQLARWEHSTFLARQLK